MPKLDPATIPWQSGTSYPAEMATKVKGREFQRLGEAGGLTQFGVNLVRLAPGVWSSHRHWHSHEDEFIWIVDGELVLVTDAGEQIMRAGDCASFKAAVQDGHHLQNRSSRPAHFLAVGTRVAHDVCRYPDVDMVSLPDGFTRKDGTRY